MKTSWKCFKDVLKTSWRCLEDIWPRRIYWSWPRHLQKTSWIRKAKANIFVLIKTSWRRILKTKTKDVFKCLQDVFSKTSVCWDGATTWSEKHSTPRRRYLQLYLNTITSTKTMFVKSKYFLDQYHYLTNIFVYLLIIAAALCNFSACNLIKW